MCSPYDACASHKNDEVLTESGLSKSRFQTEINGEKTDLFILKNKNKNGSLYH